MSISEQLRKVAAALRKKEPEMKKQKHKKCAEVLVAAKGLARFREIIQGAPHD